MTEWESAARIKPMGAVLSVRPNACNTMTILGILGDVTAAGAPIRRMLPATQGGDLILPRALPDSALLATTTALPNAPLGSLTTTMSEPRRRAACIMPVYAERVT
jgi:hypothetical protein